MSSEAKAMLDALMGNARNAALPTSTNGGDTDWDSLRPKKSCYDRDVCPLYCAWSVEPDMPGVDVYELFTNTKSDLGPNPYVVSEDAREEFMGLPDHEKDRLGFEAMLHRKLGDLVRGCDRIVSRNKEKLRQEISKAARSRGLNGSNGNKIDPVTDVSEEMIMDAAGIMAELELKEEEVKEWLGKIMEIDGEWRTLWGELQSLEKEKALQEEKQQKAEEEKQKKEQEKQEQNAEAEAEGHAEGKAADDDTAKDVPVAAADGSENVETKADAADANEEVKASIVEEKMQVIAEDKNEKKDDKKDTESNTNTNTNTNPNNVDEATDTSNDVVVVDHEEQIQKIKSKLYSLSHESQKLITKISIDTSQTIVPLRDNLQNLTKQLYYVKTDMSSDKTVCEVSGNFMSSRDAEERIAAHYAGKQYVGWKLVREKFKELDMKMRNGRLGGGGGMGGDRGGGGRGPPPRYGGGGGYDQGGGGGYRGREGYDQGGGYGGGGGYRNGGGGYGGRDRSRDRDRDRWHRDRGPGYGGGGGYHGGGGGGGGYGRRR